MITYELAKKLKENGFPQEGYFWYVKWIEGDKTGITLESKIDLNWTEAEYSYNKYERLCINPTLSELIEACADKVVLHSPGSYDVSEEYWMSSETEWTAFKQGISETVKAFGSTPEESVAKLWLAINKK